MMDNQDRQREIYTYYTNTITIDITQFISANEGILYSRMDTVQLPCMYKCIIKYIIASTCEV